MEKPIENILRPTLGVKDCVRRIYHGSTGLFYWIWKNVLASFWLLMLRISMCQRSGFVLWLIFVALRFSNDVFSVEIFNIEKDIILMIPYLFLKRENYLKFKRKFQVGKVKSKLSLSHTHIYLIHGIIHIPHLSL